MGLNSWTLRSGSKHLNILKLQLKTQLQEKSTFKIEFSNNPDFLLTAVCYCGQETYSLATGLNAAVLVTLLERQLECLRIPKMQVWLEVIFSTSMKCLRIRAQTSFEHLYEYALRS